MAKMKLPESFINKEEKTFEYDDSCPALPIPPLHKTMEKYLDSVKPHLTSMEYEETKSIVIEFVEGVGKDLNDILHTKARYTKNWLAEWWDDNAYLLTRSSSPVYNNIVGPGPFLLDVWPPKLGTQLERGALTLWFLLKFWQLLRLQQIRVDKSKKGTEPWTMYQSRRIFNTCRIPGQEKDSLHFGFKTKEEGTCPTHILVLCKGRFFIFQALDEQEEPLTAPELQLDLKFIQDRCESEPSGLGLSSLTTENRTNWAELRHHLIELHPENKKNLQLVESSILCFVLDDGEAGSYSAVGREGILGDCNVRWFDKSLSAIVFKNGTLSFNSDHAPFEGMCLVGLLSFAYTGTKLNDGKWQGTMAVRKLSKPTELSFHLDTVIRRGIQQANSQYKILCDKTQCQVNVFRGLGGKLFRKLQLQGATFIQLAIQYAYYRVHHKPGCCYQTATTKKFWLGRTDTVRSCTPEAVTWVQAMLDPTCSMQHKRRLLVKAMNKHNRLMADAKEGMACDRHLLGLQLAAVEKNIPMPKLYLDKAYTKSGGGGNYVLSTSFVGYTDILGGVGPMTKNGYGTFYSIQPETISFCVTCWKDCEETELDRYYGAIVQSLFDIKAIVTTNEISKL